MKKQLRKSYTLVEIMMVVVIAAILFSIGIPAFSTMIQGNSMTIAIRQLGAKISAARAYAVMNRCKVALLFLSTNTSKDEYKHSAYRVCIVDGDSTYSFESWIEDEPWKTLPAGILQTTVPADTVQNVNASDVGVSGTTINALIFAKDGKLVSGTTTTLNLIHGRYVNGNRINTDVQIEDNTTKIGTQPLTVNQYTGKVSVGEFKYE